MNKAITDGVVFQPPSFAAGLDVWSSGDGTPGSDTYDTAANAGYVPSDQDFGPCLEILKGETITKLRYTGETPILPGCYLQIRARIKAIGGPLPGVRVAAWAGGAGGVNVASVTQVTSATTLTTYGEVYEVSAIVGSGARGGVDMIWGTEPLYGHFGIDLTGPNGGILRIDDIEIEDISGAYLGDRIGMVDVVDYGAVGDGATDNTAAFEAADAAANGKEVYIPGGSFYLADDVTFENRVRFEGTVTMPVDKKLILLKDYNFPAYVDAFGDEVEAFKKAFQVLIGFSDHEALDLAGRRIRLTEPIDMQAAVPDRTSFATRRVIRNGQIELDPSADWEADVMTSPGTYDPSDPYTLTNVSNASSIAVGSLVEGAGVGREVYVNAVDAGAQTVTLTQALYGGAGSQNFTFTRFKYAFDFIGFDTLQRFVLDALEFNCAGNGNCIMLPRGGLIFHVKDCHFTRPKERAITSAGIGCAGMMLDRNNFYSDEVDLPVQQRQSLVFNTNGNDVKIRDNRVVNFKHFGIIGGGGTSITGNHWWHSDNEPDGVRQAGIIFAKTNVKAFVTGNYIDNNFIEWTNEYEADPSFEGGLPFGGLTITGNTFTANDVAPWFNWIVIKPYGGSFHIRGMAVIGNVFKALNGDIDRVDGVDDSFAGLNLNQMRNITFEANTFDGVTTEVFNPLRLTFDQASENANWSVDFAPRLPFGGRVRHVEGLVPSGQITNSSGGRVTGFPFVVPGQGTDGSQVRVTWPEACKGRILITGRMDRPD
ncbi:MAG: glycosyl hydrolase family 28-related protein [Pseudomonadota bacterium]